MVRVSRFMCQTELHIGAVIIGLLNTIFSFIFFIYAILDIYYHNSSDSSESRGKVRPVGYGGAWNALKFDLGEAFVVYKVFMILIYYLLFVYSICLIAAALKLRTKYVKRYLYVSSFATAGAFSEGVVGLAGNGTTEMALNYFVFSVWNIYFIICVYSYYKKYKDHVVRRSEGEAGEELNQL